MKCFSTILGIFWKIGCFLKEIRQPRTFGNVRKCTMAIFLFCLKILSVMRDGSSWVEPVLSLNCAHRKNFCAPKIIEKYSFIDEENILGTFFGKLFNLNKFDPS